MKDAPKAPTMAQIAAEAGVSKMSVSLALRGSSRVSEATRKRILEIVDRLNYRPNPMVQTLMANLRATRPIEMHSVIAWITAFETENGWTKSWLFREYYKGAEERAEQLGYRIEPFWIRSKGMTGARMSSVLKARSISGVIIPPVPSVQTRIDLDWEHFASSTIGYSFMDPILPRAAANLNESMAVVLDKCESAGYQRVGFVVTEETDERVNHSWLSVFLAWQQFIPKKQVVPFLYVRKGQKIEDLLGGWLQRHKPDVIVSANREFRMWLPDLFNLRIPENIGFVVLAITDKSRKQPQGITGINQRDRQVAASAVDLVVAQLQRNEIGLPSYPKVVLSNGEWEWGGTMRGESDSVKDEAVSSS
ncbi:MAG: hypothetical protein CML13_12860 [Puniceicoccaceae bacterium]|nr:hypothetical protein [Puniceicoccaceae bacterium]|tara:strand:+ start:14004 stop:15092 length:1089 start_codon:yes stop_codon:yes gene_type:complete